MALAQLTYRLAGMLAICLAAVIAPVSGAERVMILTAFSFGLSLAALAPGFDRVAATMVGPAILVLAVAPIGWPWTPLSLVALAAVGFTSFSEAGMSRAVPALGLPVMTLVYRSGETVSTPLVLGWVAAVVATLALGNRAMALVRGPQLGLLGQRGEHDAVTGAAFVLGRRRVVQTAVAAVMVAPLALVAAGPVERAVPALLAVGPRAGVGAGVAAQTHPGLTGGLDAGTPVQLSDDVVLRVRAERPHYWRGVTYDQWDGRRWSRDAGSLSVSLPGTEVDLAALMAPLATPTATGGGPTGPASELDLPEPVLVRQEFVAEQAGFDVVVGAWQMTSLSSPAGEAEIGADFSVVLAEPFERGATWVVESTLVPAGAEELQRADPALLAPSSPVLQRYATEDAVTPQVAELARSITSGSPTTYDMVRAIEAWMDDNITYTRDIAPLPIGSDAVHHLLFESRRGFCEQIGSALVVMLRSLGIPARLVVGYVPSEYDGEAGQWLSRGTDAHAWAEVWFPGVGWQGFDPTAGVPLAGDPVGSGGATDRSAVAKLVALAVAAVALVAAVLAWWRRARRAEVADLRAVVELQHRFDACGARLGRRWSRSMTLREKGDDLIAAGTGAEPVARAVASLERLAFSDLDHSGETGADLTGVAADLGDLERAIDKPVRAVPVAAG